MDVNYKPEGYNNVSTSLIVEGAADCIEFIKTVFGATERMRMPRPDGGVMHCELQLGDSVIMIGDSLPPEFLPGISSVHVYVPDVDATYQAALNAGATSAGEPMDMFYGDRSGSVMDAWGTRWSIATHIEELSDEEMIKRGLAERG